jgi:hypothetical protein
LELDLIGVLFAGQLTAGLRFPIRVHRKSSGPLPEAIIQSAIDPACSATAQQDDHGRFFLFNGKFLHDIAVMTRVSRRSLPRC